MPYGSSNVLFFRNSIRSSASIIVCNERLPNFKCIQRRPTHGQFIETKQAQSKIRASLQQQKMCLNSMIKLFNRSVDITPTASRFQVDFPWSAVQNTKLCEWKQTSQITWWSERATQINITSWNFRAVCVQWGGGQKKKPPKKQQQATTTRKLFQSK